MSRFCRAATAAAAIGLVSVAAVRPTRADIIIGDVAGNQTYSGYNLGPGGGLNNAIAQGFTMTDSYTLTSVDLELSNYQQAAGSDFELSIYSNTVNNGHNNPGTDLYDLSTNVTGPTAGTPSLVNFTGSGAFALDAGVTYWLVLYATNPGSTTGSSVEWVGALNSSFHNVNPTGAGATDVGQLRSVGGGNPPTGTPSTTDLRTMFQLNGTADTTVATPEPTTLVSALIGLVPLAALAAARRRRSGR